MADVVHSVHVLDSADTSGIDSLEKRVVNAKAQNVQQNLDGRRNDTIARVTYDVNVRICTVRNLTRRSRCANMSMSPFFMIASSSELPEIDIISRILIA